MVEGLAKLVSDTFYYQRLIDTPSTMRSKRLQAREFVTWIHQEFPIVEGDGPQLFVDIWRSTWGIVTHRGRELNSDYNCFAQQMSRSLFARLK